MALPDNRLTMALREMFRQLDMIDFQDRHGNPLRMNGAYIEARKAWDEAQKENPGPSVDGRS